MSTCVKGGGRRMEVKGLKYTGVNGWKSTVLSEGKWNPRMVLKRTQWWTRSVWVNKSFWTCVNFWPPSGVGGNYSGVLTCLHVRLFVFTAFSPLILERYFRQWAGLMKLYAEYFCTNWCGHFLCQNPKYFVFFSVSQKSREKKWKETKWWCWYDILWRKVKILTVTTHPGRSDKHW